jgi:hypothetical protein
VPLPELIDGQQEFLVLGALPARGTMPGKASQEYQRVAGDRGTDLRTPVLAGPETGDIPPNPDTRGHEECLQSVGLCRVLADVRDERVALAEGNYISGTRSRWTVTYIGRRRAAKNDVQLNVV